MKFDDIIKENANKHLKKIRIKVDPLYASYESFKNINYYEGYVLEEDEVSTRIMVLKVGMPIIDIPHEAFKKASILEKFKTFLIEYLRITEDSSLFHNIQHSDDFDCLEECCKTNGCSMNEISNMYKEFLKQA